MSYRLTKIDSHPGNPPKLIIAIEFLSTLSLNYRLFQVKQPFQTSGFGCSRAFVPLQPAPVAPTDSSHQGCSCFKLETFSYGAAELIAVRIRLPNALASSRFINF